MSRLMSADREAQLARHPLRQWRQEHGVSRSELASTLECHYNTILAWEHLKSWPNEDNQLWLGTPNHGIICGAMVSKNSHLPNTTTIDFTEWRRQYEEASAKAVAGV